MKTPLAMRDMTTDRNRGYGLLDVILAAVLLLGAIAGIVVLFNNASLTQSSTRTAETITTTTAEIRAIYRVQGDFSDLGEDYDAATDRVIRMGVVPENLVVQTSDGSAIMTDFGGSSRIRFRTNPASPAFFDVEISNVPRPACIRLSLNDNDVIGPLGKDYEVVADCSATATPIVATFGL